MKKRIPSQGDPELQMIHKEERIPDLGNLLNTGTLEEILVRLTTLQSIYGRQARLDVQWDEDMGELDVELRYSRREHVWERDARLEKWQANEKKREIAAIKKRDKQAADQKAREEEEQRKLRELAEKHGFGLVPNK
jgi:hypothetical protein